MNNISANDIVAFAVVNLGIQLPIDRYYEMTPSDPLYVSLMKAYKDREKKQDQRTALICAIIANCMAGGNGKKYNVDDFMPHEPKTEEQQVAELKAYMVQYEVYRKNGQIQ